MKRFVSEGPSLSEITSRIPAAVTANREVARSAARTAARSAARAAILATSTQVAAAEASVSPADQRTTNPTGQPGHPSLNQLSPAGPHGSAARRAAAAWGIKPPAG